MTTRTKLSVALIIATSALLIVGTIITYIGRFGLVSLNTSSPTDWGVFGDFFGGFLGTLISIISLIVLVRLTNYVSDQDNSTALNQFRFDFYLKLTDGIYQFDPRFFTLDELEKMSIVVRGIDSYSFLFKEIKHDYEQKSKELIEITNRIDSFSQRVMSTNSYVLGPNSEKNIMPNDDLINQYNQLKSDFLLLIQSTMVK